MRGKVHRVRRRSKYARITPAYAGKRPLERAPLTEPRDHPRLCGEKGFHTKKTHVRMGSPPPMRGKALYAVENAINLRITPAYAGKSNELRDSYFLCEDHPRLCGEKFSRSWTVHI